MTPEQQAVVDRLMWLASDCDHAFADVQEDCPELNLRESLIERYETRRAALRTAIARQAAEAQTWSDLANRRLTTCVALKAERDEAKNELATLRKRCHEQRAEIVRLEAVRAALAVQPVVPPGWKLVPVEPTPEMLKAADASDREYTTRNFGEGMYLIPQGAYDHWCTMLAASPAVQEAPAKPLAVRDFPAVIEARKAANAQMSFYREMMGVQEAPAVEHDAVPRCTRCGRYEDGSRPCPNGDKACPVEAPAFAPTPAVQGLTDEQIGSIVATVIRDRRMFTNLRRELTPIEIGQVREVAVAAGRAVIRAALSAPEQAAQQADARDAALTDEQVDALLSEWADAAGLLPDFIDDLRGDLRQLVRATPDWTANRLAEARAAMAASKKDG